MACGLCCVATCARSSELSRSRHEITHAQERRRDHNCCRRCSRDSTRDSRPHPRWREAPRGLARTTFRTGTPGACGGGEFARKCAHQTGAGRRPTLRLPREWGRHKRPSEADTARYGPCCASVSVESLARRTRRIKPNTTRTPRVEEKSCTCRVGQQEWRFANVHTPFCALPLLRPPAL